MILAHQHLALLKKEDEYLYASVMTNCKNKVVFGGLSKEDTDIMTDELVTGFVDLKAIKDEQYSTKERHRLELRTSRSRTTSRSSGETWSDSEGISQGTTTSRTKGSSKGAFSSTGSQSSHGTQSGSSTSYYGSSSSGSDSKGTSSSYGSNSSSGASASTMESTSQGSSRSETRSSSKGGTNSQSEGETIGESWVSVPEEYQELSNRTFWTKDELHYMEAAAIKNQDVAEMFLKLGSKPPQQVRVKHVKPVHYHPKISPRKIDTFRHACFAAHPKVYQPVDQLIEARNERQVKAFGEVLRLDSGLIEHDEPQMPEANDDYPDDSNPFT